MLYTPVYNSIVFVVCDDEEWSCVLCCRVVFMSHPIFLVVRYPCPILVLSTFVIVMHMTCTNDIKCDVMIVMP